MGATINVFSSKHGPNRKTWVCMWVRWKKETVGTVCETLAIDKDVVCNKPQDDAQRAWKLNRHDNSDRVSYSRHIDLADVLCKAWEICQTVVLDKRFYFSSHYIQFFLPSSYSVLNCIFVWTSDFDFVVPRTSCCNFPIRLLRGSFGGFMRQIRL